MVTPWVYDANDSDYDHSDDNSPRQQETRDLPKERLFQGKLLEAPQISESQEQVGAGYSFQK